MKDSGVHKTPIGKIAGIVSAVLWVLGFGLAFVIPSSSPWMWLPDALLLIGFWPLLYFWKPSWPILVFGILNVIIGFTLLVASFIPVEKLTEEMHTAHTQMVLTKSPYASAFSDETAKQVAAVHRHVAEQHSPWTWMIIGVLSTIYGIGRMIKNIIKWIAAKKKSA